MGTDVKPLDQLALVYAWFLSYNSANFDNQKLRLGEDRLFVDSNSKMGDRNSEKPLICYFRRRKRKFSHGDLVVLEESEKLEEVKKRMLRDSVEDEEEEEESAFKVKENDGIMKKKKKKKNTCDVNLTGSIGEEAIVMVDDDDVKPKKNAVAMAIEFNNFPSSSEEVVESERGFQDKRPICIDSDDSEDKIERLLQERRNSNNKDGEMFDYVNRRRSYLWKAPGKGKYDPNFEMFEYIRRRSYLWKAPEIGKVGGFDLNDFRDRYGEEEKGKGKVVDDDSLSTGTKYSSGSEEEKGKGKEVDDDLLSTGMKESSDSEEENQTALTRPLTNSEVMEDLKAIVENKLKELQELQELKDKRKRALWSARSDAERRREEARWARQRAKRFSLKAHSHVNKNEISPIEAASDEYLEYTTSPFSIALKKIKDWNSKLNATLSIEWVPSRNQHHDILKPQVPSLLDLSLNELAKHAYAIVSLEPTPDDLRHRISSLVCDSRRMDSHFLQLLMSGCPTEIRVRDCSGITDVQFAKIFGSCNTKYLKVLQLDLCGRCMTDYALSKTLPQSINSFPALTTISLRGACCLSDAGLRELSLSASSLQYINLGQCSLITSASIDTLANSFGSILKELYIDDCHNINALHSLPALKKFEHLEVLSVAGIETVCDAFVIDLITERGPNMKEIMLADCVNLTDISVKAIGNNCCRLRALDLSKLDKLTDSALQYLSNGCSSIQVLRLCGNAFSDEAIAAFLEVSGRSLEELSLNYITKVGPNTALSLAKYSRALLSLDLSWCRKLADEAIGLIVDNCRSLRLLKLFGCMQITEVFQNGHSNSSLRIIGLKNLPLL